MRVLKLRLSIKVMIAGRKDWRGGTIYLVRVDSRLVYVFLQIRAWGDNKTYILQLQKKKGVSVL